MAPIPLVGLDTVARTLAVPRIYGGYARPLNYHSRSDFHSNIGSIGMTIDLMLRSDAFRRDVAAGKLVMGVNATLTDHGTGRKKDLDLVIGTPGDVGTSRGRSKSLNELIRDHDMVLDAATERVLAGLPALPTGPVGQVRVALESKACMTEHGKARPRLYDELTSSHSTVHGNTSRALSLALVMINDSEKYLSPTRKENAGLGPTDTPTLTVHNQPAAAASVLRKLGELHVRGASTEAPGFDGLAVVIVTTDNNGSGFTLSSQVIDKPLQERFRYAAMIDRAASLYDQYYGGL